MLREILGIYKEFEQKLDYANHACFSAFHASMAMLNLLGKVFSMEHIDMASVNFEEIHPYLLYIESHLNSSISVEDLQAVGHVCRRKLFMLFSQHLGMSPQRFITKRKIDLALKML